MHQLIALRTVIAYSGQVLIGREVELARLQGLIDPPPADSRVLILLGEAGMGKTALLSAAVSQAAESGLRVLPVSGRESERDLAFAGLHQLLRPVLGRVSDLPQRQARALLGAFALSDDPGPPDPLLIGMAVLTLLGALADHGPLLVAADDTQWLDDGSLAALAFAARRLDAEPVTLLAAVRGRVPPAAFDRGFPELALDPLSDLDAGRLLDAQPHPPRGRARTQVLAEAAGNPMALVELSRVIAADPAAGRRWAAEPLRPTDRLAAIAAAQFGLLPAATRDTLLLAAVADTTDLTTVGLTGLSAAALVPAEAAGLVRVDTAGPQFTHPLVRSAIYHAVPFAERSAAHRRIAEAVQAQPDRYAWHLAAAALTPDEQVAALLEETAAQAQRRGGMMAAARALERAAELSPDAFDQARRLLAAMSLAEWADQADWLHDLAGRVLAVSADPVQRLLARSFAGWALAWSNRHADALATLLPVAAEAAELEMPAAAWRVVTLAASVAYQTGAPGDREAVLRSRGNGRTSCGCGSTGAWNRTPAGRGPSRGCARSPPVPSPTSPCWAPRPGCWTSPRSRSRCCGRECAGCTWTGRPAAAGPCCPRSGGLTSTAAGGTRRSPPPARRATRRTCPQCRRSPRPPTSPWPPCSRCAARTTRCSRTWTARSPR
jgi:hypothetical protein